jgi:glycosyltransferase involved in cell wall biosynthesis
MVKRLLKWAIIVFRNFCDVILALILSIGLIFLIILIPLFGKRNNKQVKKKNILFLSSESSLEAVYRKFGDFNLLFSYNPRDFFDHVYCSWFPTSNTLKIALKDNYTVLETRVFLRLRIVSCLLYFIKLYCLVKKENISMIRAWDPFINGLFSIFLAKLTGVPFCVSIHADYDLQYQAIGQEGGRKYFGSRKIAQAMQRFVLSHSKMVMPISGYIAKYAIRHGAKPETLRVIPHGIDASLFLQPPDKELKKWLGIADEKVVSFVARLSKDKYANDVIEIASRVCQIQKDVVFLIVGDGKDRENLEKLSHDLGLDKNIKFLGYQPHNKVAQIMLLSDINLCLLSGFSLIEGAMSGKPIVAYDIEWHSELIKNNETGLLVAKGDIEGAANAILKILDNAELARKMGENARRLAIEKYSLENTSKIKIKCYEELLRM